MNRYRKIMLTMIVSALMLTGCGENPSEEGLLLLQEGKYEDAIAKFQEAIDDEKNMDDKNKYYKNKFYMVYTAEEHMGVAVADSPLGPFTQENKVWLREDKSIDGHF